MTDNGPSAVEAVRQVGNGLNNLHAALLAHQSASARDRQLIFDKIDAVRAEFSTSFADLSERILDVCDRGGREHRGFSDEIATIRARLDRQDAHSQGRAQAFAFMAKATSWLIEHGWKAALVAYVGWQAVLQPTMEAMAPRAFEPTEIRGTFAP